MHQADNIPTNFVPFEIYALGQRSTASSSSRQHITGMPMFLMFFLNQNIPTNKNSNAASPTPNLKLVFIHLQENITNTICKQNEKQNWRLSSYLGGGPLSCSIWRLQPLVDGVWLGDKPFKVFVSSVLLTTSQNISGNKNSPLQNSFPAPPWCHFLVFSPAYV